MELSKEEYEQMKSKGIPKYMTKIFRFILCCIAASFLSMISVIWIGWIGVKLFFTFLIIAFFVGAYVNYIKSVIEKETYEEHCRRYNYKQFSRKPKRSFQDKVEEKLNKTH